MFFILGTICNIHAQIYHRGVCYYIPAGEDLTSSTNVYVVKFTGNRVVLLSASKSTICSNIQENRYYYDEKLRKTAENTNNGFKYKSSFQQQVKKFITTHGLRGHQDMFQTCGEGKMFMMC